MLLLLLMLLLSTKRNETNTHTRGTHTMYHSALRYEENVVLAVSGALHTQISPAKSACHDAIFTPFRCAECDASADMHRAAVK